MTARIHLFGLALAGALAASLGPAAALDDGQESLIDTLTGIVSFGNQKPGPEIDYRERAPLVLPKNAKALPQPVQRGERSAAWPVDPDVQRRKEAEAKAKMPFSTGDKVMMSKRELMGGRAAADGRSVTAQEDNPGCRMSGGSCLWVNPDALRSQGYTPEKKEVLVVGQEPERAWLTQPPKGYRKATQATGVGKQTVQREEDDANPLTYFLRPFRKDDDE